MFFEPAIAIISVVWPAISTPNKLNGRDASLSIFFGGVLVLVVVVVDVKYTKLKLKEHLTVLLLFWLRD